MDRESLVNYSAKCSMNHPLSDPDNPVEHFRKSFMADDAASVKELFQRFPAIKARINEPVPGTDDFLITLAKSPAMVDVLIEAGADLNTKSTWWAGGFGLLQSATPELARHAIQRGAVVDILAAARLGMAERVKEMVLADPVSVHARGGDGQTPLHFASTVEIAAFLLDHGADIDARDIDHESTAAQYMIADRTEVARYLAGRGAATDLLLAAALGDRPLIDRHLADNPESIRIRVSEEFFPMLGGKAGGTIYQWTLGWHAADGYEGRSDTTVTSFGPSTFGNVLHNRVLALDVNGLLTAGWTLSLGAERLRQSTDNPSYVRTDRDTDVLRIGLQHDAAWGSLQAHLFFRFETSGLIRLLYGGSVLVLFAPQPIQ